MTEKPKRIWKWVTITTAIATVSAVPFYSAIGQCALLTADSPSCVKTGDVYLTDYDPISQCPANVYWGATLDPQKCGGAAIGYANCYPYTYTYTVSRYRAIYTKGPFSACSFDHNDDYSSGPVNCNKVHQDTDCPG